MCIPCCQAAYFFGFFINTPAYQFGRYKPSPPSTRELDGLGSYEVLSFNEGGEDPIGPTYLVVSCVCVIQNYRTRS